MASDRVVGVIVRRRTRARLIAALVVLLAGAADVARAFPHESREWRSFRTEHFVVLSDAAPSQARDLAADLEHLRSALDEVTDLQTVSPVPTVVFLFENAGTMRGYRHLVDGRPATLAGAFYSAPHADFLIVDGQRRREATVTVFHEYVHKVLRDNLPGLPLWLEEGLAELFSTFELRGGDAILGAPAARHLDALRSREPMSLRALLAVGVGSEEYTRYEHQGIFYAQSWLVVHALWLGRDPSGDLGSKRRRQALDYVASLFAGTDRERAFVDAFGVEHAVVEREIRRHRARGLAGGFPLRRVPLDPPPIRVASSPLRDVDLLVRLGELLASQNGRGADAERHFREALRRAASADEAAGGTGDRGVHARAWAGLGLLEEQRGDLSRARAFYAEAVRDDRRDTARSRGSDDALVPYLYGSSLVVFGRGTRPAKLREAREHLRVSLERDPTFAPAWARLRDVEALLDARTLDDRAAEDRAADDEADDARPAVPDRPDVAMRLLVLHARAGARQAAGRLVEEWFEPRASPALLADARRVLERIDWLRAESDRAPELLRSVGDQAAPRLEEDQGGRDRGVE